MSEQINKSLVEFIPGDTVKLNPANVVLNDFYYGELNDPEVFGSTNGVIKRIQFCDKMNEMSYQVQFNNIERNNVHWFLEHELY